MTHSIQPFGGRKVSGLAQILSKESPMDTSFHGMKCGPALEMKTDAMFGSVSPQGPFT